MLVNKGNSPACKLDIGDTKIEQVLKFLKSGKCFDTHGTEENNA